MRLLALEDVGDEDSPLVGGKAVALSRLVRAGLRIPPTLCLTSDGYRRFAGAGELASVVVLELGRKPFEEMRWEELWDAALRIRNRFLRAPMAPALRSAIEDAVHTAFAEGPLVVRSSAPGEDSAAASFAGLHESIVGVELMDVVDAVRRVWASLWSDRALLYRQELGLDIATSSMAVVLQALVEGDASGVAFSVDPTDEGRMVIEAVHGLNQGLVDGAVQPDRWFFSRRTGELLRHDAPPERLRLVRRGERLVIEPLVDSLAPLESRQLDLVRGALRRVEEIFGSPQDMEWTFADGELVVLQARPVTTGAARGDQRAWYLSLTRSLDNLRVLRRKVEGELLPEMDAEAAGLSAADLERLDNPALADEIARRHEMHDRWVDIYWKEFIPLAHGVRLFGQFYNDVVRPDDPFEFMDLLAATPMLSLERNRLLEVLAEQVRRNPALASGTAQNDTFEADLDDFIDRFGNATVGEHRVLADRDRLLRLVVALASRPTAPVVDRPSIDVFLTRVEPARRRTAEELLELARTSYQLRDDDNIHLAAIKAEVLRAVAEGRRRLGASGEGLDADQLVFSMRHPNAVVEPKPDRRDPPAEPGFSVRARQIVGQPAGPGVAVGRARIVDDPDELFAFQPGEIIVCDAVEPNMTFIVPLAAAVVERRGGMLIHGAIIAREYGLPCVTGVPEATTRISTGDQITVDGFLGIVTVE